jgi:AraC-like DNA-binding protein
MAVHSSDVRQLGALPTSTGRMTRLACARMRAQGIETEPLLKKARLNELQMLDNGARLNVQHQIRFLNLAAGALQDEFLGFHLAQVPDLRELGLLYYVPASSNTLEEALRRVARYSSMTNESLSLEYAARRDVRIKLGYVGVSRHLDRHQIEFCLAILIRLCRQLTGRRLAAKQVRLAHRRGNASSEFSAFFNCDITFGAAVDEIVFDSTIRHIPIVSADPYLNELLVANCEDAISRRPQLRGQFRSSVENAIVPLLPHGKARVSEIAPQLGLSRRTFARRLTSEGLTFSGILESLRRDLALQYLVDSGLSVSEIAWLLGYGEASSFTHAFKRWFGETPRETRSRQGRK